jgi:hypothetical protein
MDAIKSIRRNPIGAMFIGGIAISLIFSQGNIRQNASAIDGARQIAQANAANQLQLQATEQANQQRAKIAESRYQSGCVVVVALKRPRPIHHALRRSARTRSRPQRALSSRDSRL